MQCPHCGKEVPEDKKFCGYCGQALALPEGAQTPGEFDEDAPTVLVSPEEVEDEPAAVEDQGPTSAEVDHEADVQTSAEPSSDLESRAEPESDPSTRAGEDRTRPIRNFPWLSLGIIIAAWLIGDWITLTLYEAYDIYARDFQFMIRTQALAEAGGALAVGGLTWLALKRVVRALDWKALLLLIAGWGILLASSSYLIFEWFKILPYADPNAYTYHAFTGSLFSLIGALGGLVTALALRKPAGLTTKHVLYLALGWAAAMTLSFYLTWDVIWGMMSSTESERDFLQYYWWLDDLIHAMIGGVSTLGLLSNLQRKVINKRKT